MIAWPRVRKIATLAAPVAIALGATLMMTLIDLAMVGSLGNNAVAAVGLSSFSYSLVLAFVLGIAPAVQGQVARRRGEQSTDPLCLPLNAGIATSLIVGVPLSILCFVLTPFIFPLISTDAGVTRIGIPYLQTLYTAVVAVGLQSAFRGFWAGVERPGVTMRIVLFMNVLNCIGNYALIHGNLGAPRLGATGAAVATAASLWIGVVINCVLVWRHYRKEGFLTAGPVKPLLSRIVKVGAPATVQEFLYSAGYVTFLWIVGQVGTAELAAASVLVRITLVLLFLAMSLGSASATLVSKSIGEGDFDAASRWGWDSGKLGVIFITLVGLPLFLFPEQSLSVFLTDPHTIQIAIVPLQMLAATTGVGSLIWIFAYTLFTIGDGKRVAIISFTAQWFFFLPAVWFVGVYLKYGLLQIWLVQMAYGVIATSLITAIWADGRWKKIRI